MAWVAAQKAKLRQEVSELEKALAAFDEQHDLRTLPGDDQVELVRKELMELSSAAWRDKPGVAARRKTLQDKALELNLVSLERARLARSGDNAAKLLALIEEQESKQQLAWLLDPPLRLLDSCAVCER
jgi:hypothetical protein